MSIRWRDLLDHLGIEWTDRGRNVSRGWIAIPCCWCGNSDPSKHLGINEAEGHYRCLRNPTHRGRSAPFLLKALLQKTASTRAQRLDELFMRFGAGEQRYRVYDHERASISASPFARRWNSFKPAALDPQACAYLSTRKFWHPARTAELFDLRVGAGRWAARLWFPLTVDNAVVGFTGRAMDDRQPRYLTESADAVCYCPQPDDDDRPHKVALVVEGPMDALRLADIAFQRYNYVVVALCGLSVTDTKRMQLLSIMRNIPARFVILDSSVSLVDTLRLTNELPMKFNPLSLPRDIDDPADMTNTEIETWLNTSTIASLAR